MDAILNDILDDEKNNTITQATPEPIDTIYKKKY